MEFRDLFKLVFCATIFEGMLKNKIHRKNLFKCMDYKNSNFRIHLIETNDQMIEDGLMEVGLAEVIATKPQVYYALVRALST